MATTTMARGFFGAQHPWHSAKVQPPEDGPVHLKYLQLRLTEIVIVMVQKSAKVKMQWQCHLQATSD